MKKTELPYKVYHLDVISPEARENQPLQQAYIRLSSLFSQRAERVAAAKEIRELGGYRLAASVDAATAQEAIMLTTVKGPGGWAGEANKRVEPTGLSSRSTAPLDIISRFDGEEFLLMPLGMLSFSTCEFTESVE